MLPFLTQMRIEESTHEYVELTKKVVKGIENLSNLTEEDIQIGVTPKEAIYQEDKIVLYRFKPVVEHPLAIPV